MKNEGIKRNIMHQPNKTYKKSKRAITHLRRPEAQSVTYLTTDTLLTVDPGVASSIPPRSVSW